MTLENAYFRATEHALYSYPSIVRQRQIREQWLEAMCERQTLIRADGGSSKVISPLEMVTIKKENDWILKMLYMKEEAIKKALEVLQQQRGDLMKLVEMKYFRGLLISEIMNELCISRAEYFRRRRKAIEIIAPFVCGIFAMR